MIRTVAIPCKLPQEVADAFNLESGRIYTQVLVQHYRIYRKKGIWLSAGAMEKLNDFLNRGRKPRLHAHSIDAAQQGFPKACKTARVAQAGIGHGLSAQTETLQDHDLEEHGDPA
jgi:hypothetical protein